MQLDLPLERPQEAERLRTAVYRFAEMKAHAPPVVAVHQDGARVRGEIRFWSPEAALEFEGYWSAFAAERRSWSGFRDV